MMKSVKVPNHVLVSDHAIYYGIADTKIIEAGTFVKPISYYYLPKHVIEDPRWSHFNSDRDIFCYTPYGIVPIDKKKLREV